MQQELGKPAKMESKAEANKSQRSGTGELSMQSCSPQKEDTNYRKDLPAAGTILILTKHSVLWGHCCENGEGGISGVSTYYSVMKFGFLPQHTTFALFWIVSFHFSVSSMKHT